MLNRHESLLLKWLQRKHLLKAAASHLVVNITRHTHSHLKYCHPLDIHNEIFWYKVFCSTVKRKTVSYVINDERPLQGGGEDT